MHTPTSLSYSAKLGEISHPSSLKHIDQQAGDMKRYSLMDTKLRKLNLHSLALGAVQDETKAASANRRGKSEVFKPM